MRHLDVAGGTGDVAFRVLWAIRAAAALERQAGGRPRQQHHHSQPPPPQQHPHAPQPQQPQQQQQQPEQPPPPPPEGHVTVCDINGSMLEVGRAKAAASGLLGATSWVQGDAEKLPFPDESVDAYTIAFGIRNVTDRPAALREARRVLRRGGRFLCLEFSQVRRHARARAARPAERPCDCRARPGLPGRRVCQARHLCKHARCPLPALTPRPSPRAPRALLAVPFCPARPPQVTQPLLRQAYDAYSFAVIPRIGQLVAGDGDSYQYLVESIRQFPDQVHARGCGFLCAYVAVFVCVCVFACLRVCERM